MSRKRQVAISTAAMLVVSFAMSALFLWHIDRLRSYAAVNDALYVTSPKLLKQLSLGYEGLLADVYWTRAVQYYGAMHHSGGGDYKLLWPLLNIASQLDPHLTRVYEFGGPFLSTNPPNGAGLPQRGVELVEYGIHENPDNWHLYYDLGFIHYDLKDYNAAADAFLRGSKLPNAHPVLKVLAARMAEHGGDVESNGRRGQGCETVARQILPDVGIAGNPVHVELNVAVAADVGLPHVRGWLVPV